MRPYAASGRAVRLGVIRLFHPKSRLGIGVLRTVEKTLTSAFAQSVFRRFGGGDEKPSEGGLVLPKYEEIDSSSSASSSLTRPQSIGAKWKV